METKNQKTVRVNFAKRARLRAGQPINQFIREMGGMPALSDEDCGRLSCWARSNRVRGNLNHKRFWSYDWKTYRLNREGST
ncbi:MAG: hypothetical protein V7638_3908 [Acidobacteriota bacterium]|jgi:hypothetical protein